MPTLTKEQASPHHRVPLYGRKGMLTTDPDVLIQVVGDKVAFGADASGYDDAQNMFYWTVSNSRDMSYMIGMNECRKNPDISIEILYRKPYTLLMQSVQHGEMMVEPISLSPGSLAALSYRNGIERIEDPDGEVLYDRKEKAKSQ